MNAASKKILIADDDASIRLVLSQAFTRLGYQVRATGNAATLLKWVTEGDGDLVITDVVMPDENVFDVLPRIRKQRPKLPVIVMSAQNTLLTAISAAEGGLFDYMPKPLDLDDMAAVAKRALERPADKEAVKAQARAMRDERLPLPTDDEPSLAFVVPNLAAFEDAWSIDRRDLRFAVARYQGIERRHTISVGRVPLSHVYTNGDRDGDRRIRAGVDSEMGRKGPAITQGECGWGYHRVDDNVLGCSAAESSRKIIDPLRSYRLDERIDAREHIIQRRERRDSLRHLQFREHRIVYDQMVEKTTNFRQLTATRAAH